MYSRKRAAARGASPWFSTTKGRPSPALARPSIRWRLTEVPMPNANTFAVSRRWRTSANASGSTLMYPSVATTTVRDTSGRARGKSNARLQCGQELGTAAAGLAFDFPQRPGLVGLGGLDRGG